ncbi:MAG: MarR family transcriptional regulator [Candidatus Omnitrophota bacterium]
MKKSVKKAASAIADAWPALMSGTDIDFLAKNNITSSQLITVTTIHFLHKCSMGQLSKNLQVTMPTVTGLIDRLIRLKLVTRNKSEEDRRKVYIELTPKGRSLIGNLQSIVCRKWERLLSALSAKEVDSFQNIFRKLKSCIEEQKGKDEA